MRHGQDKSKREMLLTWLGDSDFKTHYFKVTDSIGQLQTFKVTDQWMSKTEVYHKYGKKQAKAMIANDVFVIRNDPQCPQFRQYLVRKQAAEGSVSKGRKLELERGGEIKKDKR